MEFKFSTVDQALTHFCKHFDDLAQPSESRNGTMRTIEESVTVAWTNPQQRVIFNPVRDANPFFHLFESLWMLAGCQDVKPLLKYNSKMGDYSDDGETFYGAYGYRWRRQFLLGRDQLAEICTALCKDPTCRRQVLQIWSCAMDLGTDSKDLPCNTHAYFRIVNGCLNMTVCNRSNDLLWGMLGANVVHFSFLQEYMAARIGVPVGYYYQFTNNLHVYDATWNPQELLEGDCVCCHYPTQCFPLVESPEVFDREVEEFVINEDWIRNWEEPFFQKVASPMCWAFELHKRREYAKALSAMSLVEAPDWCKAGREWIFRRKTSWEKKNA